jgi:multicomponent Na+:H+ antiporter subunit B
VQKTREIGLLKSLGFGNGGITGIFFWMGLVQGVLGNMLGVGLGGLFLSNPLPLGKLGTLCSSGLLPIIYLFVGLKVAAEITVLIEYFIRTRDA